MFKGIMDYDFEVAPDTYKVSSTCAILAWRMIEHTNIFSMINLARQELRYHVKKISAAEPPEPKVDGPAKI